MDGDVGVKTTRRVRLITALLGIVALSGCATAAASTNGPGGITNSACTGTATGTDPQLTPEQNSNAQIIISTAASLGLGVQGATIGVVAAITESTLQNLNYGDIGSNGQMTTSRGLFQMKDAWGTLDERLNPASAAKLFFTVDKGPGVEGLIHIQGWQQMSIPQAAQAVEGSQFSSGSNYAGNLAMAQRIVDNIMKGGGMTCSPTGAHTAPTGVTMNLSQNPPDYGWFHPPMLEPLTWQGHNFGQVAAGTAKLWAALLDELVPRIPGGLNSNIGCFEDRANVNNPSVLSLHAYGLACDLNADANPNGSAGYGRSGTYVLPPETHDIANKWGFVWGGDFTGTPDPMHLELHLTPQQVAAITATL